MAIDSIIALVVSGVLLPMYIVGALVSCGVGGVWIAGYHFDPKGEKAKKYHKYVMLRIGLWFTALIAQMHACVLCAVFGAMTWCYVMTACAIVSAISGVLYITISPKIKNALSLEKSLDYDANITANENNTITE